MANFADLAIPNAENWKAIDDYLDNVKARQQDKKMKEMSLIIGQNNQLQCRELGFSDRMKAKLTATHAASMTKITAFMVANKIYHPEFTKQISDKSLSKVGRKNFETLVVAVKGLEKKIQDFAKALNENKYDLAGKILNEFSPGEKQAMQKQLQSLFMPKFEGNPKNLEERVRLGYLKLLSSPQGVTRESVDKFLLNWSRDAAKDVKQSMDNIPSDFFQDYINLFPADDTTCLKALASILSDKKMRDVIVPKLKRLTKEVLQDLAQDAAKKQSYCLLECIFLTRKDIGDMACLEKLASILPDNKMQDVITLQLRQVTKKAVQDLAISAAKNQCYRLLVFLHSTRKEVLELSDENIDNVIVPQLRKLSIEAAQDLAIYAASRKYFHLLELLLYTQRKAVLALRGSNFTKKIPDDLIRGKIWDLIFNPVLVKDPPPASKPEIKSS
jgi:hypothetical protein